MADITRLVATHQSTTELDAEEAHLQVTIWNSGLDVKPRLIGMRSSLLYTASLTKPLISDEHGCVKEKRHHFQHLLWNFFRNVTNYALNYRQSRRYATVANINN